MHDEGDEDEEVGEQLEQEDGDPFDKKKAPLDEEMREVEVGGESLRGTSSLSKLRRALKKRGLGRGKNKSEEWKMLVHQHQHFAENLSIELSRKEFQKKKMDEGDEPRVGQKVQRMPSKSGRQAH